MGILGSKQWNSTEGRGQVACKIAWVCGDHNWGNYKASTNPRLCLFVGENTIETKPHTRCTVCTVCKIRPSIAWEAAHWCIREVLTLRWLFFDPARILNYALQLEGKTSAENTSRSLEFQELAGRLLGDFTSGEPCSLDGTSWVFSGATAGTRVKGPGSAESGAWEELNRTIYNAYL